MFSKILSVTSVYLLRSYFHDKQSTLCPALLAFCRCCWFVPFTCRNSGSSGLDLDSSQMLASGCFGEKSTCRAFDCCEEQTKERHPYPVGRYLGFTLVPIYFTLRCDSTLCNVDVFVDVWRSKTVPLDTRRLR